MSLIARFLRGQTAAKDEQRRCAGMFYPQENKSYHLCNANGDIRPIHLANFVLGESWKWIAFVLSNCLWPG